jgi:hypothetical protein
LSKTIDTLVKDIYAVFEKGTEVNEQVIEDFGRNLGKQLADRIARKQERPTLRVSNLGTPDRKLWYSINKPELGEPLAGSTRLKFLIGDLWEEVIMFLAKVAGHEVTDEQKQVSLHGVKGHIDGRVSGRLVDVKSASPYSFKKFASGGLADNDPFGYISQLSSYAACEGDAVGSFVVADKVSGKLHVDTHEFEPKDTAKIVADKQSMLMQPEPPPRCYPDIPDGAYGNRKLGVECSYCAFKQTCWPGLRAYKYYNGPVFMTNVAKEPKVPEIPLGDIND